MVGSGRRDQSCGELGYGPVRGNVVGWSAGAFLLEGTPSVVWRMSSTEVTALPILV